MSKIIFLDIDGPMIPVRAFVLPGNKFGEGSAKCFDHVAVAMINTLVEFTGAKVVLSSSWRCHFTQEQMLVFFEREGLHITFHEDWATTWKFSSERCHEIKWWLDDYPETTHYVIIDDARMPENFFGLLENSIPVDPYDGLLFNDFRKAIEILGHTEQEYTDWSGEKRKRYFKNKPTQLDLFKELGVKPYEHFNEEN